MDSLRPPPAPVLTFEQFVRGRRWVPDMTTAGGTAFPGWIYPGDVYAEYLGEPYPSWGGGRWYAPVFSVAAQSDDLWEIEAAMYVYAESEGHIEHAATDAVEYT